MSSTRVRPAGPKLSFPCVCLVAALAGIFALGAGCGALGSRRPRVLVIGIDGASPHVSDRLLAAGRLPHLAGIAAAGVSGEIESAIPLLSPRIWNTISTGKTPEKHGIVNFIREDEAGERRLMLSTDRRVHSLWNIASDAGRRVAVINWWNTFPPEKVAGVMVSDHLIAAELESRRRVTGAAKAPAGTVAYPASRQPELFRLLAEDAPPVTNPDPFTPGDDLPSWSHPDKLRECFTLDAALVRIALAIEADEHPDLLMVLLPGIDRVSHRLWGTVAPASRYPERLRPTPAERRAGAAALEQYYEYTDALIGVLVERFAADDLVIVLSDHGFEAGVTYGSLTGTHQGQDALYGVFFARGAGIPPGQPAGEISVRDITPTVLAWWNLPVADDMDGHVASFLPAEEVARIPTYDIGPVERLDSEPSGAEAEIQENLRALGYIE